MIPFRKARFEKQLRNLRDLNSDLAQQRSYAKNFQELRVISLRSKPTQQAVPHQYGTVRNAAQSLHEALITTWCCTDSTHANHYAKMCLDDRLGRREDVSFDMAISSYEHEHGPEVENIYETHVWLNVQSTNTSSSMSDGDMDIARDTPREASDSTGAILLDRQSCKTAASKPVQVISGKTVIRPISDSLGLPMPPKLEPDIATGANNLKLISVVGLAKSESVCKQFK